MFVFLLVWRRMWNQEFFEAPLVVKCVCMYKSLERARSVYIPLSIKHTAAVIKYIIPEYISWWKYVDQRLFNNKFNMNVKKLRKMYNGLFYLLRSRPLSWLRRQLILVNFPFAPAAKYFNGYDPKK